MDIISKKTVFFIKPHLRLKFLFGVIFSILLCIIAIKYFNKNYINLSADEKMTIRSVLSKLTVEEQGNLREIADYMFLLTAIPHTLFGSKPVSFTMIPPMERHQKGRITWNSISHHFTSKKYIAREIEEDGRLFFLIANLREVQRVYIENQTFFEQEGLTFKEIKSAFIQGGKKLEKLLENTLYLGIFLGFGKNNSELFVKNSILPDEEKIPLHAFAKPHVWYYYYFSPILPVFFACDPTTEETIALKERYSRDRKSISKLYRNSDLFDLMLLKLSGHTDYK
jgi:hypothetical protein